MEPVEPQDSGTGDSIILYDHYGFAINDEFSKGSTSLRSGMHSLASKWRAERWRKEFKLLDGVSNLKIMKKLIRGGIPEDLRPSVWCSCLGSKLLRDRNTFLFYELLDAPLRDVVAQQIDMDLRRTFPEHRQFRTEDGLKKLSRVLRAFAIYKPEIEYCQGLNFVAAMLLVVLPEDLAFWSLCQLLDSEIPDKGMKLSGYYKPGMVALKRDLKVLEELMKRRAPEAYVVLRTHGATIDILSSSWFLCLFVTILPTQVLLRVWDIMVNEGPKILFRVALTIFLKFRKQISNLKSFEDIMMFFKHKWQSAVDCEDFIWYSLKAVRRFSRKEILSFQVEAEEKLSNGSLKW